MRVLLIALFALAAAVLVGHYVAADPGFIVIGYGGKVVRTTFAFFVLVLVALAVVLYTLLRLGVRLFELRRRLHRWSAERRRRRAHRSLADGMLALAGGDYARAEKLFNRGIDADTQPEVHYLAAAEAAEALHAPARRDNYLKLAHEVQPDAAAALDLKHAAWLIENGQLDEAGALLARLELGRAVTPRVLKLKLDFHRARGEHAALLALLPALRRDRVVAHEALNALERDSALAVLVAVAPTALEAQWQALSKAVRAEPAVLAAYVERRCRMGQHDAAEALVRKQLDRHWNGALAARYGDIVCQPPARQLRRLEAWAMKHEADPGLKLARAKVALRAQQWAQARDDLEQVLATAPSPLLYRLLAEACEGAGDPAGAARQRRLGLELATADEQAPVADSHAA